MKKVSLPKLLLGSVVSVLAIGGLGLSDASADHPPGKGGKITVHMNRDIGGFDHIKVPQGGMGRYQVLWAVYDKFFEKDENGNIVPRLALSAKPSPDYKTWQVKLRDGVRYSPAANGEALTAKTFAHHYTRLLSSNLSKRFQAVIGSGLQSVKALDRLTLEFKFAKANLAFKAVFADGGTYIMAANALGFAKANEGKPDYSRMSAGSGPYMVKEWVPGKGVTLVRNPNFWNPKEQHLDEIFYRITSGPETGPAWNAFRAGDLDVMWSLNGSAIARANKAKKYQVGNGGRGQLHFSINFQASHKPLDDARVRRALAHAIDRKVILKIVGKNATIFADQSFPENSPWFCKGVNYPEYNPAKAKALLKEVGKTIPKLEIWTLNIPSFRKTVEIIQAMWKKVGVESELKAGGRGPTGVVFKIVKGQTPTWMNPRGSRVHPTVFNMDMHSTHKNNIWKIKSKRIDNAIANIQKARSDAEVKKAHCAFEKIKTEEVAYMPIQHAPAAIIAHQNIGGITKPNDPVLGYHKLWLKK